MNAADAFTIRLTGIAAPRSRVRLLIDRDTRALSDRIIDPEECDFGQQPASCVIRIDGGTPAFEGLVRAFKAGHLEITNPGFEAMSSDTSLVGFTKAFDAL